jgi:hypothetical protein
MARPIKRGRVHAPNGERIVLEYEEVRTAAELRGSRFDFTVFTLTN